MTLNIGTNVFRLPVARIKAVCRNARCGEEIHAGDLSEEKYRPYADTGEMILLCSTCGGMVSENTDIHRLESWADTQSFLRAVELGEEIQSDLDGFFSQCD